MKQIIYNGDYYVSERDIIALKKGELLVKPIAIYIGLLEAVDVRYTYPSKYPIVPGSLGIVRVLEGPYTDYSYSGKLATVNPLASNDILGLSVDGILSSYATVHEKFIHRVVNNDDPYLSLTPLIEHGIFLGKNSYGKALIIGCNVLSYIVAKFFDENKHYNYALFCRNNRRVFKKINGKVYTNMGEIDPYYDSITVLDNKVSLIHSILDKTRAANIIVSKYSLINLIPLKHEGRLSILYTGKTSFESPDMVMKIMHYLKKRIKVIKVDDISKVLSLLPPRGFGLIINFK